MIGGEPYIPYDWYNLLVQRSTKNKQSISTPIDIQNWLSLHLVAAAAASNLFGLSTNVVPLKEVLDTTQSLAKWESFRDLKILYRLRDEVSKT